MQGGPSGRVLPFGDKNLQSDPSAGEPGLGWTLIWGVPPACLGSR